MLAIRGMGTDLPLALMAITTILLTPARLMATTDLAGLWVASSSARARGIAATGVAADTMVVAVDTTAAVDTAELDIVVV